MNKTYKDLLLCKSCNRNGRKKINKIIFVVNSAKHHENNETGFYEGLGRGSKFHWMVRESLIEHMTILAEA